ncbi:MAG: hypothetical protein J7L10_01860 [Methanomicrobia archaeon]|nr:hypothetical protein [Methanomicrobia archaeon]RLF96281.1 MAG: hypothetical protein DRN50_02050 [Thermococci archaeon]RLG01561.1 MAG: hypothetical protein DRN58_01510 [Thermococci archaeon]HDN81536.1 hypothetical protein [Methanomicrobia archaeon]HEC95686.1 hypothetical protein [Euryarchaeota archaeon]
MLSQKEIKLITETRDLLEELLETLEIMGDKNLMEEIRKAQEDIKEGRVRDFDEFVKELD